MKRILIPLCLLPFVALVGAGFYLDHAFKPFPPRVTTGFFKVVIAETTVKTVNPGDVDFHDTEITVAIDYQGPTPKWWGARATVPDIPHAQIGGTRLVDNQGKIYRDPPCSPSNCNGLYNMKEEFDKRRQQYLWTYCVQTRFVPPSVHHLTFKSQIIHPTGTLQISVPVRDTA